MGYTKIGWLAGISVLFALLAYVGLAYISGNGWRFSAVQTASMSPGIPVGTLIIARQQTVGRLQPGSVGIYQNGAGATIVHRLQAILPNGQYVFRGDANPVSDDPVNKNQVIGRLSHAVPFVGGLATFMKSWLGLVLCIYIPAVLFIAYEVNGLARRLSHANDKSFRR